MVKKTLCVIYLMLCIPLLYATDIWISLGNIFTNAFKEPFEILYLVCYDGTVFSISTRTNDVINVDVIYVRELLQRHGKAPKDVAIMMHNHFFRPTFSTVAEDGDLAFLADLRRMGFKGSFCIYMTSSKKIICKEAIHGN